MTIEEKVEAYDEVIERAKIYYSTTDSVADAELIELIFPELKESEDERIRKALRKRIIRYDPNNEILIKEEGISQKQFLAWLEKQEETKYEIFDYDYAKFTLRTIESWIINGYKNVSPYDKERIKKGINLLEHLLSSNKQAEQKPVWSEEDEKIVEALNAYVKNLDMFFSEIKIGDKNILSKEFREKVQLWLKSLENRVQHKAEWSKVDEYNQAWLIEHLYGIEDSDKDYELKCRNIAKWLKSLRPQSKQEWNKEDKIHYIRCLQYLESISPRKEDVEWLKSLCPQDRWKPSEEQMKALAEALSLAKNCGEEWAFDLRTLYEELKKLREEKL